MYYFSFMPNINFTMPRKHFGTFFTTIVIFIHSPFVSYQFYLQDSQINPTITTVTPIANSQPDSGSNNTNKMPSPIPIKHTPIVFFNNFNILYLLPLSSIFLAILYSYFFNLLPFYVFLFSYSTAFPAFSISLYFEQEMIVATILYYTT